MTDVSQMTDEELQAATDERARRAAEEAAATKAAFLEQVAPLLEVGFGGTKQATVAEIIAALDANRATVPREWFSPLQAALTGLETLNGLITSATAETPIVTPPPMIAAP